MFQSGSITHWMRKDFLLHSRWAWHLLFWTGYVLFRFWLYYITVTYYPVIFLEYMLLSEIMFIGMVYFTIWLYQRLFHQKRYLPYFTIGAGFWIAYLYGRTVFQFYYLQHEPAFQRNTFIDIFINNITVVIVYFLFITACKYFKDGYISQHVEAQKKEQQLQAEVNHLKSQIAPHFLFNTLNNLYGLSVEKSDQLPDLLLRLSNFLRHSLYEAQKPVVPINDELNVLKSYINLESVRMEDNLKLVFDNSVPQNAPYHIAPLILIVFMENAFKHAKLVQFAAVDIHIQTMMKNEWFSIVIRNNYNKDQIKSVNGIGLANVIRRLELLYPNGLHQLTICQDDIYFEISLQMQLQQMA